MAHVYQDHAVSGATTMRPGYQEMVRAAEAGAFDVLLVYDLSRLSRDDIEMKTMIRKLLWWGIRVVGVGDGYDSSHRSHKIHAGFKGLMNELHLDDIRSWTHKALVGKSEDGYCCGGRVFGYRNVPIEDPTGKKGDYGRPAVIAVRYEIDEAQADVVRDIYAWSAAGYGYRWIAAELNRRGIRSSRGGAWAATAIKVILDNPMYEGELIWNRTRKVRNPETGRRVHRPRPREEWIVRKKPELRIVPEEVAVRVRARQRRNREKASSSLASTPAQKYLFSGLMRCGSCGGNMVVVSKDRYGCSVSKTHGTTECKNRRTVSREIVERRLLAGIKARLAEPDCIERFKKHVAKAMEAHHRTRGTSALQNRLDQAKHEQANLLAAIKQGIVTATTKMALEDAEREVKELTQRLLHERRNPVSSILPRALQQYQDAVDRLETRLGEHVDPAREILRSLLGSSITLHAKGDHFEAEVPDHTAALLATSFLADAADLCGAQSPACSKSYRVCLAPTPDEPIPPRHRVRKRNRLAA